MGKSKAGEGMLITYPSVNTYHLILHCETVVYRPQLPQRKQRFETARRDAASQFERWSATRLFSLRSSDCVGGLGFYGLCDLCDEMEMEVEAYTGMERDG